MRNSKELKVKYAKGDGPKKPKNKNVDPKSELGYSDSSPYRNLPYIDIHTNSGLITMDDTGIPLLANGVYLPPYSGTYKFPGNKVREIPLAQDGKEVDSDYNMERAKQLYTPDETGHWPSIDYETGEWLKSKEHPTAWMEYLYGYTLNPQQALRYDVRTNPEGYFGDNTLQYVPKKEKGGSWLKQYQSKNSQVSGRSAMVDAIDNRYTKPVTSTKPAAVTQAQPQQQKSIMFMTDAEVKKMQEDRKRQEQQLALAKYTKSKHDYLMATDSNYRREFQRVDNAIKAAPYRQAAEEKAKKYQNQIDRSFAGGTGVNVAVRESTDTQQARNMRANAHAAAREQAYTEVEAEVPAGIHIRNEPESYLPGYDKAMKRARNNSTFNDSSISVRESTDTFNQFTPDRQGAVMSLYRNPEKVYFPEDLPPPPLNWRDVADPLLLAASFAKYSPDPWGIGKGIGYGADLALTGLTAYDTYENLKHGDYGHAGLGISSLAAGPFGRSSNRFLSQIGSGMGKVNKVYKMHKIYSNLEDEQYVQGVLNSIRLASGNPVNLRRKEGGSKLPPHLPEAYREGGKFDKFLVKYQAQKSIVGQAEDWLDSMGRSVGKAIANNPWFSEADVNKAGSAAGKQIQQTYGTYDPNKSTARNIADTAVAVGSLASYIPTPITQGIGAASAAAGTALAAYDASQALLNKDYGSAAIKGAKAADAGFGAMSKSTNPWVKGIGTAGQMFNKGYSMYTTAKDMAAGSTGNISKDIQTGSKGVKTAIDATKKMTATPKTMIPNIGMKKYGGHNWLKNYK